MEGEKVVESLFRHRDLWEAVILDRLGHVNYNRPRDLRPSALIKLRDLPWNVWNADMLYLLTKDAATAERLAQVIRDEDWGGEVYVHTDPEEIGTTLGGDDEKGIVAVWWD